LFSKHETIANEVVDKLATALTTADGQSRDSHVTCCGKVSRKVYKMSECARTERNSNNSDVEGNVQCCHMWSVPAQYSEGSLFRRSATRVRIRLMDRIAYVRNSGLKSMWSWTDGQRISLRSGLQLSLCIKVENSLLQTLGKSAVTI